MVDRVEKAKSGDRVEQQSHDGGARLEHLGSLQIRVHALLRGVSEVNSGVYFCRSGDRVLAQLGSESVTLEDVSVEQFAEVRRSKQFSEPMQKAYAVTVMPKLIEPVLHRLREEIRSFKEKGASAHSSIKEVEVLSTDPLEFTIKGLLYSGRTSAEYEGSCTWNGAGTLTVVSQRGSTRVPVAELVKGNHGILGKILSKLPSAYGT
jgi:hypothetical protein